MESKSYVWESGSGQHTAEKRLAVVGRSGAHLTVNHDGDEEIGPVRVESNAARVAGTHVEPKAAPIGKTDAFAPSAIT